VERFSSSRILKAMAEQWIVRVEGKDYGPVALTTLREWRDEGRVLPANEARLADTQSWITAIDIPGLFEAPAIDHQPVDAPPSAPSGFIQICLETVRIYAKGWFQFFGLTLLVVIPSICAQLTGMFLDESPTVDINLRSVLTGGFAFCMLLLGLAAWPIYVAGIQILTAELAVGRRLGFFAVLTHAIRLWPRVAVCSILVYGAFFFWTALPLAVILMIALGGPSIMSFFLVLAVACVQVWIVGRLFVNFLFWQQCAVLDGLEVGATFRESKRLARSGRDLSWFKRPLWRGVFISSLWVAFALALAFPVAWPAMREYFHIVTTTQDPQALVQALSSAPKAHGFNGVNFGLSLLQAILRPLLGIAFVLLYFDARSGVDQGDGAERNTER
jgi:hypothetical protein